MEVNLAHSPDEQSARKSPARMSRREAGDRLLDAAERLLVQQGYAAITTRSLAEEAGVNHGLVHYYFGSMEELFFQVLERFTERLIARQRAMYARPAPYLEKWREAMRYLDDDRPYQKIFWELQAMAWNRPEYQERLLWMHSAWREAMRSAVGQAVKRYHLDTGPFSVDDWITLIVTMNTGIIHQRLAGFQDGHTELLSGIDRWLSFLEANANTSKDTPEQP